MLVRAFGEGRRWGNLPAALGKTLGYALLSGEPASPSIFLNAIENQARGLDQFFLFSQKVGDATDVPTVQRFLCQLLAELRSAVCSSDEPLILAVDGVDELPRDDSAEVGTLPLLLDFLPPPDKLPAGCYILLTSRPDVPAHIRDALSKMRVTYGPGFYQEVVLSRNDGSYLALLEEYLVRGLGDEVRALVPAVLEKSQGRFLYVRFLRDWLRLIRVQGRALRGLPIADLPETDDILPAYLAEFAKDVNREHCDPERFARWHRQVLLLIAAALEPVDRETISFWLGDLVAGNPDGDHLLDCTLDELSPLLKTERRAFLDDRVLYSLGHAELADWFAGTEHPEWIGAVADAVERIVARGRTVFTPEALSSALDYEGPGLVLYHFRHLASHLLELEDTEGAREFLELPWQESFYEGINAIWRRSAQFWDEMLECARGRLADYLDVWQASSSDDANYVDHAVTCLSGIARAFLTQIEAHDRLGRNETAIHLSTKLVNFLDRFFGLLPYFSNAEQRQYWRLVAESHISRARVFLRHDQNEKALESAYQAYAVLLHAIWAKLSSGIEETWMAWFVHALSEVTNYMTSVNSRPGQLLACLADNRGALDLLQTIIKGQDGPDYWLRHYPSVVAMQLRMFSDRVALLLRLAEDGVTAEEEERLASVRDDSTFVLTVNEHEDPLEAALAICHDAIGVAQTAVEQCSQLSGGVKHAMVKVPQLFTAQGLLFRNRAKVQEAIGNRPAAIESYRTAFDIFPEVVAYDCPGAIEQLLTCSIEWISFDGFSTQLANGEYALIQTCIQLNVMHKRFGRRIATAEVCRCAETLDAWLGVLGIGEQLGEEFRRDWSATCRTLKRLDKQRSRPWWSGDDADLESPEA